MASGLPAASVTADGGVRAEDGQVLLSTAAPIAARSARELLRWDSASDHVRALKGAKASPSPVDRAKPGSKHHVITEGVASHWR